MGGMVTAAGALPVAVIGAGPYGLSTAAHLRAAGVAVRAFGIPMSSWRERMPAAMLLKSTAWASTIAAPEHGATLADFCGSSGSQALGGHQPIPIGTFIDYGEWYQRRFLPELEPTDVEAVERRRGGYALTLSGGQGVGARAVVLATGFDRYAHVPGVLGQLPADAASHSSAHREFSSFAGRTVAVIGAGQSALETAALLRESGAFARLFARKPELRIADTPTRIDHQGRGTPRKPESPLGPGWSLLACSRLAAAFRRLPARSRLLLVASVLGPAGAWWLRDRVASGVELNLGHRLVSAEASGGLVRLEFVCVDGVLRTVEVDHVIAATGYAVDLERLSILEPGLRGGLRRLAGRWPWLDGGFESSTPGLYFTGLASAASFGPLMRFVCGTGFAARRLTASSWRHIGAAGHRSGWCRRTSTVHPKSLQPARRAVRD